NATLTINSFDDYQFYEVDEYSLVKMGRRWFGDNFNIQNSRAYNFKFPNLIESEPVEVKILAAAASEIDTHMDVRINDQPVGSMQFNDITENILAMDGSLSAQYNANSDEIDIELIYNNMGNPASTAYLDFISIEAERLLQIEGKQLHFTNEEAASASGIGEYVIQNASDVSEVWDVTNLTSVFALEDVGTGNTYNFKAELGAERKYVAILPSDYHTPQKESDSKVENQNLKGTIFKTAQNDFEDLDYLLVTTEALRSQAEKLANHRRNFDGLHVKVVTVDKIYTEFSTGKQDIVAIRNFIKYIYDNASSIDNRIKYIGLLGEASVDYKDRLEDNNNIVPTYEDYQSFSLTGAFVTDDFYGMMDPLEGNISSSDMLDIAIGRMLADDAQMAEEVISKIIDYDKKESYGRWRNNVVTIADDAANVNEFYNLIEHTDDLANGISLNKPTLNVFKIYLDAFQQESSAGGDRYPAVNDAINDAVEKGALVINYFGHGGESGLAHERVVTQSDVMNWSNTAHYPLFVTVTCQFTKFDNPLRISAGELVVTNPTGGAAGLISTTREITIPDGKVFNNNLNPFLYEYGGPSNISIAEALRKTKNSVSIGGKRNVSYFGDPAMKLSLPDPNIRLTKINDVPIETSTDTLKALSHIKFTGEVVSPDGNLLSNYNGILAATVFDKEIERQTLGNDNVRGNNNQLLILDFTTLGEIIFRGQASVTNGLFEFDFVVPRDIAIPVGEGRVSFYAEKNNELEDQTGYNNSILIGGLNENAPEDNEGPEILLYMNDENFVSGGTTNSSPFILAKLADENGINTASGIGHDIVAIIDGDESNPYILNDYYETEVDDYTKGTAYYKLRDLEPGLHTMTFKAWDVYNNSSIAEITFLVAGDEELSITKVLNYPNPFHNYTEFWFNHNRPFEPLEVQVQVFTVTGKIVWSQNQTINTDGFLSREITWDGKDDFGDAIGKGVYVYKLTVKSTLTNKKVEKFEKLVIL
ncbi:MAG TPA: type IX secretion system sortase PorU, partial [Salinimicrobium sp.]|nr:type IX secretion system sortase PorU [Salinimicrobium sp.]